MRKIHFLLFLFPSFFSFAQQDSINLDKYPVIRFFFRDTADRHPGFISLNLSQTSLSDWQGGGSDNFTIVSLFKFDPILKRKKYNLIGKVDAQYGLIKTGSSKLYIKNIDRLFLLSKFDIKTSSKYWFYSVQGDFRTQFAPGYSYVGDSLAGPAVSDFMCPAYAQLAGGIDFKLGDYFSTTFAPAAGKVTIVNRQYLADAGAFGVTPAVRDSAGNVITPGKRVRYEFGGRVIVKFKKDITKNIYLDSYVDLFSNYSHKPQNIDVVINNTLILKLSKYFSVSVISQLLYDDDINIVNSSGIHGPRLQALTTLAIGLGIKF